MFILPLRGQKKMNSDTDKWIVSPPPQVRLQDEASSLAVGETQGWRHGGERLAHHGLDWEETYHRVPGTATFIYFQKINFDRKISFQLHKQIIKTIAEIL